MVDDDGDGVEDRYAWDRGPFESYAGAVYWHRTDGKCIRWGGYVKTGERLPPLRIRLGLLRLSQPSSSQSTFT